MEIAEQVYNAASVQLNKTLVNDSQSFKIGFYFGADWAYNHPAWRMCEDELPEKPCRCVCCDGELVFLAEWVDDTPQGLRGWSINGLTAQPIAWFPLPKFNPKAEKE